MPTTNTNRKILDLKRWEFCTPAPVATAAGRCIASSVHGRQQQLYLQSSLTASLYNPSEDGWVELPSPALAGSFGDGCCAVAGGFSTGATAGVASLTATAGSTTTITTNQTLARDLRGYSVQFVGGTNAGKTKVIASNGIGANAVITFTDAEAVAFDNTSAYRLVTPTWYVLNGGTLASGSFKRYDFATNTWVTLVNTGLPATWGTDGRLVATPSWIGSGYKSFATGTATAGASTTLTNSAKAWATNQWTNSQVRITAGTGAGQIRTVASNTGTVLTVSAAWATTPDNTSQYSLEGNDDFIYALGNAAVAMYRYSISANTWSTLSPGVARGGAAGTGLGGQWVHSVSDAAWTAENAIQNGRYIYSFRGVGGALLDRYDIAANAWAAVAYAPASTTFTIGTKHAYIRDYLYIHKDATGRWFRFDIASSSMDGWNTMLYPNSTAVTGDTAFDVSFVDGETEINYVYVVLNSLNVMLRQMVI
jgi:hypothetical protein